MPDRNYSARAKLYTLQLEPYYAAVLPASYMWAYCGTVRRRAGADQNLHGVFVGHLSRARGQR